MAEEGKVQVVGMRIFVDKKKRTLSCVREEDIEILLDVFEGFAARDKGFRLRVDSCAIRPSGLTDIAENLTQTGVQGGSAGVEKAVKTPLRFCSLRDSAKDRGR